MNLGPAIRTALLGTTGITSLLAEWEGEPSIHTRRPLPDGVVYPAIAISTDISHTDEDAINSFRDVVVKDVVVYGNLPDEFRIVEALGYLIRDLFHRDKFSLMLDGYGVIDIVAFGPRPAPVDDDKTVGRVVTLTIRLYQS